MLVVTYPQLENKPVNNHFWDRRRDVCSNGWQIEHWKTYKLENDKWTKLAKRLSIPTCAARRVLTRSNGYVTDAAVIPAKPPPTRRMKTSTPTFSLWFSITKTFCNSCKMRRCKRSNNKPDTRIFYQHILNYIENHHRTYVPTFL